jgi:hypothetical protein
VAQIYAWRIDEKLGIETITDRLNADPAAYPPTDAAAGGSAGGVAAMLRNPNYTGYQVIGRRRLPIPRKPGNLVSESVWLPGYGAGHSWAVPR